MNNDKKDKYGSTSNGWAEFKTCPSDYYKKEESSWDKGWGKTKDTVSGWFSDKKEKY